MNVDTCLMCGHEYCPVYGCECNEDETGILNSNGKHLKSSEVEKFLYYLLDDDSDIGRLIISYQTIEELYSTIYGPAHQHSLEQVQSIIFRELRDRLFKYNDDVINETS